MPLLAADDAFGIGIDSANRVWRLLDILTQPRLQGPAFWAAFTAVWPACDDIWHALPEVLKALRRRRRSKPPLSVDLQWPLTIYRGCSRKRAAGISWTTALATAEGFARGHRGIPVDDPAVVWADVGPDAVFCIIGEDRGESEVIVDPRRFIFDEYC